MRKRGQAAAFIIIGIILLIIVIGFITVKRGILSDLFEKISGERRLVPQQLKPVQDFLDSCVTQLILEGTDILAQQGGYIDLPLDPIPTTPFTPLGPNLEIIPNSGFKTSVWFREKGNGIQETNMPSIDDMENSLSDYIAINFARCVNNLTAFAQQGYIAQASSFATAKTEITENRIITEVNFPVNIKILDTDFTLSQHKAEIDSKLGRLYSMAKEIIEKENQDLFLEQKTIDMLVAYNDEVPFSGTDLSCNEKIWLKTDVEQKLKNILFENVAVMHIKGSSYKLNDEKLSYMEFDPLETKDSTVNINLMYFPSWPTLIEINPSEGNILRSDQISKKAGGAAATVISSFLCLNTYRFVYDIKYPVLVVLTDPSGLTFQFATEVIIDNNQPRENNLETLDLPDTASPICQYPQRQMTIYTATTDENDELVPLTDVSLSFKCFPASCPLGTSDLNPEGEPQLKTLVPLCFNGVIEGFKDGYKQVQKTFFSSNDESIPSLAVVVLEPTYKKQVNIFVVDKNTGQVREPYETEQISFQFAHIDATYQTSYLYPNEDNTMELLPGDYVIDSYILRNSSTYTITLPKQTIESCIDTRDYGLLGFFKTKQVCSSAETEPMEFDTILTGGATRVEHTFTKEELANDNQLNLYILASPIPGSLEELERTQIEVETNKDHPLFKYPEIK